MRNQFSLSLFTGLIILVFCSCSSHWTKAIRNGRIVQNQFEETVDFEVQKGLIFTNVLINGKKYRFLFDSGAPFSVSEELQEEFSFKKVSTGNIVDSDHNRKKITWVKVGSAQIGNVSFVNQTALVVDLKANPILECLHFDGIIGSNLMRHCNWTIDQEKNQLRLSSSVHQDSTDNHIKIPFDSDVQYNILLQMNMGRASVKKMKVDYGSNGAIALKENVFSILKDKGIIDNTFTINGSKQSGVIGKPVKYKHEITISDSVSLNNFHLDNVEVKSSKSALIGNKVLSRFIVTIDWNNRNLYLTPRETIPSSTSSFGIQIGFTDKKGTYIQSVIENSKAYHQGLRPEMKVVRLDQLDFKKKNDYCDYVFYQHRETLFLEVIDLAGEKKEFQIEKTQLKK